MTQNDVKDVRELAGLMSPNKLDEQLKNAAKGYNYIFLWGLLTGSGVIRCKETKLAEIKKLIDRELAKTNLPVLTDREFSDLALTLKLAQSGMIR